MTAETTILEIAHGALGPAYLDTIKVMYQQAVEDGVFETVESEYEAGIDALNAVLSSKQTAPLISTIEEMRGHVFLVAVVSHLKKSD